MPSYYKLLVEFSCTTEQMKVSRQTTLYFTRETNRKINKTLKNVTMMTKYTILQQTKHTYTNTDKGIKNYFVVCRLQFKGKFLNYLVKTSISLLILNGLK